MPVARLHCRDLREPLPFEDATFHGVLCDPPYGLSDISLRDVQDCLSAWCAGRPYVTRKKGFMGHPWDGFVPGPEVWREVYRVLKPGASLLAFGGTRTVDLLTIALRLSGFEIRDSIGVAWVYGQGKPQGIDVERVTGDPAWKGYHTRLKGCWEPVILARKPGGATPEEAGGGVCGLNIDGCRVGVAKEVPRSPVERRKVRGERSNWAQGANPDGSPGINPNIGRHPPNVVLVHSPDCSETCAPGCPVAELDAQSGELTSGAMPAGTQREGVGYGGGLGTTVRNAFEASRGGASRFFHAFRWEAKDRGRTDTTHPCIKPVQLTAYLAKLLLPPDLGELRRLLVPFCGSGSEVIGGLRAGWEKVDGVEIDETYIGEAEGRIAGDSPLLNRVERIG